jgi:hypothetical protein
MNKQYYDFNGENMAKRTTLQEYLFELRLFNKMKGIYFQRTPESDSLYRRRNRLVILALSGLFYYKTSRHIFDKFELKVLMSGKGIFSKLVEY